MNAVKLNPCPFCGSPGEFFFSGFNPDFVCDQNLGRFVFYLRVKCSKCWVKYNPVDRVYLYSFDLSQTGELAVRRDDRAELAEIWNRRYLNGLQTTFDGDADEHAETCGD